MQVALIHGMGRTPLSMGRLARALRRRGHHVEQIGYSATLERVDAIVDRVRDRLESLVRTGVPTVAIGHSLGGLLVRLAIRREPSLSPPLHHLIMLGPPNQSPVLARRLHRFWLYRWINGDAGQRLADPAFYAQLRPPEIPYTIVAGTGGRRGRWSVFGEEPNDGLVMREETRCTATDEPIEVPARHTFLMNHATVRALILERVGSG
jgi:pimeloyl-ACP methyl ester carboxylesterase